MVYNSFANAVTNVYSQSGDKSYFRNCDEHFNKIYFKYQPDWKKSDIGEMNIGILNMKISIKKCMQLEFMLYILKYKQYFRIY